jgi:hypothetical protein
MTLRDRCVRNPLRWWPVAFTCGYLSGWARGRLVGRLSAWREANEIIADHRTRFGPQPVSTAEVLRREAARARRRRW